MKPLLTALAFLAWVSTYLTLVAWLTRYRKRLRGSSVVLAQNPYRADKDVVLWALVFAVGVGLFFLVWLAARVVGDSP